MNQADEQEPPPPTFDALPLSPELRRAVDELGYTHPTPVQRAVFEPASRGGDVVVQARTGTGKTAAFGLPILDALVRRNLPQVQALILCPTRELALQVSRELEALSKFRGVSIVAVYGGAPMPRQVEQLQAGAQVLVGTPGRVLDHLSRGTLDPSALKVFVLDESDEMLSMGFLPQINDIQRYLPEGHQTLLFSATLPAAIERMAETRLRDPEFLTLSGDHIGALEIDHWVYISRGDKLGELIQLIEVENPESAIIFCNTRDETKRVAGALKQQGFAAEWLNADLAQSDREKVMWATRHGQLRFLVCTDVAARGIDISHLTHVINHDFPESAEAYVHRTGRTGRAGRTGTAISLVAPKDIGNLYMMRLTYKIQPIEKQLPSARELKTRAEADLVSMFAEAFASRTVHADDLALARRLLSHEQVETVVAGLLRDHLGARPEAAEDAAALRHSRKPRSAPETASTPPTTPSSPSVPEAPVPPKSTSRRAPQQPAASAPRPAPLPARARPIEPEPTPVERERPSAAQQPTSDTQDAREDGSAPRRRRRSRRRRPEDDGASESVAPLEHDLDEIAFSYTATPVEDAPEALRGIAQGLTELYVNVGRKDGASPDDFEELLRSAASIEPDDTGYIRVRNRHSFVAVQSAQAEQALAALNGAVIAGKKAAAELARERE